MGVSIQLGGLTVSLGLLIMILGGLIAVVGALIAIGRRGAGAMIVGIVLAALGLGGVGIGYTFDQQSEVTYTVQDVQPMTARDNNQNYRVQLQSESGVDTWIYIKEDQLYRFTKGEEVTMRKSEIKALRDEFNE
ncbi:MAG: hypothetical protein IKI21_03520 [Oscillospiraceae bacterium]|nr:hypothetical protein [Oscillospiraceae bacterium]